MEKYNFTFLGKLAIECTCCLMRLYSKQFLAISIIVCDLWK